MTIQLSDHFTYKRLIRFVLPSIVMMLFSSIYGIVDGLFVSNFVGKTAFAAINLVFPFLQILGTLGFMIGTGGTALIAKTLGEGERYRANQLFTMLILIVIVVGGLISYVAWLGLEPIVLFLGATPELLNDAVSYGQVLLAFNVAFMLQCTFQSFMVAAEKPQLGLYFTIGAGVMNMIMDALLVWYFKFGLLGAAWATVLSQVVGGIFPLLYFCFPNDSLLKFVRPSMDFKALIHVCSNGASEFVNNISTSVISMVYNWQLLQYLGENGVAAYGALMYVAWIFFAILSGYMVGSAPIISFHYGAMNKGELKNLLKKSLMVVTTLNIGLTIIGEIMATTFIGLYVGYDAELCAIAVHGFRLFILAFIFIGYNMFSSSFFTALNNGPLSAFISFLRVFGFQLIAVVTLPGILGIDGIWLAGLAADFMCTLVSGYFLGNKRKVYGY